ncbi:MAG: hypothetical protein PWP46_2161 [Fusobacteriaceae bacterium]|nr:4Fe-4S ferredoxin [Fusobacteriales bacterium]MDN5305274.1 hypothetical protein [Fusobacteriaceae bacterium]
MKKIKAKKNRNSKKVAVINQNQCDKSPFCPVKRVCPVGAIVPLNEGETQKKKSIFGFLIPKGYKVDEEKCTGCGVCVTSCPMQAVSIAKA